MSTFGRGDANSGRRGADDLASTLEVDLSSLDDRGFGGG